MERRYQAAYNFGILGETLGWVIAIGGTLGGILALAMSEKGIGTILIAAGLILGLGTIVNSQIMLTLVDTENNTRQALKQLEMTNRMLSDTLGRIAVSVNKTSEKE
jgi:hypothetical protein